MINDWSRTFLGGYTRAGVCMAHFDWLVGCMIVQSIIKKVFFNQEVNEQYSPLFVELASKNTSIKTVENFFSVFS